MSDISVMMMMIMMLENFLKFGANLNLVSVDNALFVKGHCDPVNVSHSSQCYVSEAHYTCAQPL